MFLSRVYRFPIEAFGNDGRSGEVFFNAIFGIPFNPSALEKDFRKEQITLKI